MTTVARLRRGRMTTPVEVAMADHQCLCGDLGSVTDPRGLIVFAHGSGSSRHSSRNQYVAGVLEQCGFATLLIDLVYPLLDPRIVYRRA